MSCLTFMKAYHILIPTVKVYHVLSVNEETWYCLTLTHFYYFYRPPVEQTMSVGLTSSQLSPLHHISYSLSIHLVDVKCCRNNIKYQH